MTEYKDIKNGAEFVHNGITYIKISWIAAQIKGKRKFLSFNPCVDVKLLTA